MKKYLSGRFLDVKTDYTRSPHSLTLSLWVRWREGGESRGMKCWMDEERHAWKDGCAEWLDISYHRSPSYRRCDDGTLGP